MLPRISHYRRPARLRGAPRRLVPVAALLAVALALAACSGGGSREEDGALRAATDFAAAWAAGDFAAAGRLTTDPEAAAAALVEAKQLLLAASAEVRVAATASTPAPASMSAAASASAGASPGATASRAVPLQVTWRLNSLGDFGYPTVVPLTDAGGQWRVVWSPRVLHPDLTASTRFSRNRSLPPRARILDAQGRPLMWPQRVVTVGVQPRQVTDPAATAGALARLIDVDPQRLAGAISRAKPDAFVPALVLRGADYDTKKTRLQAIPGVLVREGTRALAPTAEFARAVLGVVGPATDESLANAGPSASSVDEVGLSGLQRLYQRQLAGTPSGRIEIVERMSRRTITVLHEFTGAPGTDLRTTLDLQVQQAAEKALAGVTEDSSIVVVDARSGQLRAVANGPGRQGQNLAFTGQYQPGSTFKVVTSAALLASAKVGLDTPVACPKTAVADGKPFGNVGGFVLGTVPFRTAVAQSCNTAFVLLAKDLPPNALAEAGRWFGLGGQWDAGLPAFSGLVPVPDTWVDTAAAAIGQGKVLASPLAMAMVAATVAAGQFHPPTLLAPGTPRPAASSGATPRPAASPGATPTRPLPAGVAADLRTLMRGVVTQGSGKIVDLPGPPVGAKTGTAEHDGPNTHAWMIGYRGDLAFAVLLANGGAGGHDAGPVARTLLENLPAR